MNHYHQQGVKILKQTRGACPECLSEMDAFIIRVGNEIILQRRCLSHGDIRTIIARNAEEYEELFYFYQGLNIGKAKQRVKKRHTIFYTNRCGLDCPICFMHANFKHNIPDPTNASIRCLLRNIRNAKINIFGGEPTIREDLPELIRLIRDSGNLSALFTNGIRFSNLNYAQSLKLAGLNELHLQFDGFNAEVDLKFRNVNLLDYKLMSLKNAEAVGISVVFEVTVDHKVNYKSIPDILDYALDNRYVRGVCFRSYCALGKRGIAIDSLTMDDLIKGVEFYTRGIVKAKDILVLQKLAYIMAEWLKCDWCFSHRYMLIYRNKQKKEFLSLGDILNFDRIAHYLDGYLKIRKKSVVLSRVYFILFIVPRMFSLKRSFIFMHLLGVAIASRFYRALTQSSFGDSFLVIDFESPCDRFTFDLERTCNTDVIAEDLKVYPSFYMASLQKERFYQEYAQNKE